MTTNITVALLVLSGAAVLAWAGIADPAGGIAGAAGRALRGEAEPVAAPPGGTAGVLALYSAFAPAGSGTSSGTGSGTATVADTTGAGSDTGSAGSAIVAEARRYLGTPYRWGGTTPRGFDCSGFAQYVVRRAIGVQLPRVSQTQAMRGELIGNLAAAGAGDLLFFGAPVHHVGIYIGAGRMVAAPKTGDVVKEQSVYATPTFIRRVTGLRKVVSV